LKSYNNGKRRI